MRTTESLRNNLIEKILSIKDKEVLSAIDKLLESSMRSDEAVELTEEQKILIRAGLKDIKAKRLISDEQLNKEEDEWLAK